MKSSLSTLIGLWVLLTGPRPDERGLSQSTETAILVAGVVVIAIGIVGAVSAYVTGKMGALGP